MFLLYNTIISFAVCLVLILLLQQMFGWRGSFITGGAKGFLGLMSIIGGIVWMLYLIISSAIFFLLSGKELTWTEWLYIAVPIFVLMIMYVQNRIQNYNIQKKEDDINNKRKECIAWVKQFEFIHEKTVIEPQVYESKNKIVGRLNVYYVSETQKNIMEQNKSSLPKDIFLAIYTK